MRIAYLLALSVLLACSDEEQQTDAPPWQELTFLDRAFTTLTLANGGDLTIAIELHPREYLPELGEEVPDSLAAGDSLNVIRQLYRPETMVANLAGRRQVFELLPGFDRTIVYRAGKNEDAGRNRELYAAFTRIEAINPYTSGPETARMEYDDYALHQDSLLRAAQDTLANMQLAEDWQQQVLRQGLELRHLQKVVGFTSYRKFFYKENIVLADSVLRQVDSMLASVPYAQAAYYSDLFTTLSVYKRRQQPSDGDEERSIGARNFAQMTADHLQAFPQEAYRREAIAALAEDIIRDRHTYAGREVLLDSLKAALPEDYRDEVNSIERKVLAARSDETALRVLLATPFVNTAGDSVSPLAIREKEITLYKFWFTGCVPCLIQQPAEEELLAQYPALEVVYLAYKTPEAEWLPYLEKHQPPTTQQLYLDRGRDKLVQAGLGGFGAPQYLLVSGEEVKIVCRSCPKPNDKALAEMIDAVGE